MEGEHQAEQEAACRDDNNNDVEMLASLVGAPAVDFAHTELPDCEPELRTKTSK